MRPPSHARPRRGPARLVAAASAAALVLSACAGADTTDETDAEPAAAEPAATLQVVATTSILGDLVEELLQEQGDVTVLMGPGVDPHGYQPSARDAATLREAELVVANGLQLEESLLDTLEAAQEDGVEVFELAPQLDPIEFDFDGDHGHSHGGDDHGDDDHGHGDEEGDDDGHRHDDDHGHEDEDDDHGHDDDGDDHGHSHDEQAASVQLIADHGHDDGDDHGHDDDGDDHGHGDDDHGHAHGPEDPHVWFDPVRMVEGVGLLADALIAAGDDLDADAIEANAARVTDELEAIHAELEDAFAQASNRIAVTNHDALGYLAARYDFEVVGTVIPGASTQVEADARQFAALIETVEELGIDTVFAENTDSTTLADQLASEVVGRGDLEVEVVRIATDALDEPGSEADTYLGLLRSTGLAVAASMG